FVLGFFRSPPGVEGKRQSECSGKRYRRSEGVVVDYEGAPDRSQGHTLQNRRRQVVSASEGARHEREIRNMDGAVARRVHDDGKRAPDVTGARGERNRVLT